VGQDEAKLSGLQDLECLFGEPDIENYYQLASQKKQLDAECQRTIMASKVAQAVPALRPPHQHDTHRTHDTTTRHAREG
jgi:hypothetical protein